MASPKKSGENLSILREIYNDSASSARSKQSIWKKIREFFSDEKRLNALLSVAVLLFGFGGVFVGLAQVRSRIFIKPKPVENRALKLAANPSADQDLLGLSKKDTDQDELSDYDELYLYGTSPYLSDSDSDGIADKREIALGSDPLCNKSGSCLRQLNAVLGSEANADPAKNQSLYVDAQSQLQQLRKALVLSGMSEEELAGLTDEQLVASYQDALAQSTDGGGANTISISGVTDLQQLTPTQIREILRTAGISDEVLNKISDSDLLELMKQVAPTDNTAGNQNANVNATQ